ncbi:hypothetical protein GBAR_LOCUS23582 [Geodia barretti]|nr:hypothetical protein GBAR_LOCUS23582 [Geodia barretti]
MSAVSSRDGRDTPLRQATPSSRDGSCSSVLSGLSVENVSLAAIDSTVQYLRESLEEEIEQRRQDVALLQECNEGERAFLQTQSRPPPPPPSLRELRGVGTLLEREVMSAMTRGSPLCPSYPSPGRVVQLRPPPLECSNKSTASFSGMRRASGVRPRPIQSSPDPVINRTDGTVGVCPRPKPRQSSSEVFSPAPRYTGITTAVTPTTTHCTSIT